MIEKLTIKNNVDIYDFVINTKDVYQDFYVTFDKSRFFMNNLSLINKILTRQECFGVFQDGLKGILIVIHEKNFRPYVKILATNNKYIIDLLKYLKWTYAEQDLYFKLKRDNPLSWMIVKTGFVKIGDRGRELLFYKKGIKQLYHLTPKDEYINDEEGRLY